MKATRVKKKKRALMKQNRADSQIIYIYIYIFMWKRRQRSSKKILSYAQ